jgi:UDP-galactopyranose mutase
MYDTVIVGAGLAGLTSARILAEQGKKVLVVEKHRHIGGHCHDYRNEHGITIHTYGPHIFHTQDKDVWDFVTRYSDFNYYQHRVLAYSEGSYFPFPINRDTLAQVLGREIPVNQVHTILQEEASRASFNNPPENFRDVIVSQVGERLYSMFFKNYTRKQWEKDPEELSPEVAKRIPVRDNRDDRYFSDPYQGIPQSGYTALAEKIANHENITLMLGADYFAVKELFNPELTIFTGELDRFFNYQFGKLEYRSLRLELKTFDTESYQDSAVINYPNDYDWTRITEYKKISLEKSDKTTVCFEYPLADGEPYYVVMTKENLAKRAAYMKEVEKLEQSGSWLFIGRLAEYTYYNMDQVIKRVFERLKG